MAAKKQTFESSMARLEEIVRKMEQGDTPLDVSVALLEEGTEQKVTILRPQPDGSVQESPFIQEEP